MKKILLFLGIALFAVACSGGKNMNYFGEKIKPSGAVAVSEVATMMADVDSLQLKVEGPVTAACQKKGCWMNMDMGNGETMMVRFKDYGFFVPKDAAGSTAIADGWAYRETVSVDELRHYAEDAGKPKEEIEAITEPETRLTFIAKGVILKAEGE